MNSDIPVGAKTHSPKSIKSMQQVTKDEFSTEKKASPWNYDSSTNKRKNASDQKAET